jgi:hypothetical protein
LIHGIQSYQHLLKVIILGFPFAFVVNTKVDGLMLIVNIGVIQRDQVDTPHRLMMLARPNTPTRHSKYNKVSP